MKSLISLCILALFGVGAYRIVACGPFFSRAIFVYSKHPDIPRTQFLAGRLGVLQPTYARSYLFVAYRYLNGTGFNAAEREQVRLYWNDRDTEGWEANPLDWYARWQAARVQVPGTVPQPASEGKSRYAAENHSWQQNCSDDAFRNAVQTLADRRVKWGRSSPLLKDWVEAQDSVFDLCTTQNGPIPEPADDDAPPLAQADRRYQIAAAEFYSGHHQEAVQKFRAIAAEASSPWKTIAPYLVARVLTREAIPLKDDEAQPLFAQAQEQIDAILADRTLTPIHGMSRVLLRRIRSQAKPQQAVRELARAVMQSHAEGSLRQDLWDYRGLLNHFLDFPEYEDPTPEFKTEKATLPRHDDVTDWIVTFQSDDPKEAAHAIQRWRRTGSLPWLINALSHASTGTLEASELIAASTAIPPASPAYWHAAYHRNRLRIELGDKLTARTELELLKPDEDPGVSKSAVNLFRALRMQAAPDLAAFLRFGQRMPVAVTENDNYAERPDWDPESVHPHVRTLQWDRDSIRVLNERAPLRIWQEAALSHEFPAHLRQEFVLAAFARAILLDDDATAQRLAELVTEVLPRAAKYVTQYRAETTPGGRHFAGVFLLQHYAIVRPYLTSGVQWETPSRAIDSYVNAWWCSFDSPHELDWDTKFGSDDYYYPKQRRIEPDVAAGRVSFLKPEDIAAGKAEVKKLGTLGPAPDYFATQTIKRAEEQPDDRRIPEALHYAVTASYYGCNGAKTAKYSKAAFALLHGRYAKSPWAEKTPYWYDKYYPPEK